MIDFDVLDDDFDVSLSSIESKNVDDSYVLWCMMNGSRVGNQQSIYTAPPASYEPSNLKGSACGALKKNCIPEDESRQYSGTPPTSIQFDSGREPISKISPTDSKGPSNISNDKIISPEQALPSGKTKNVEDEIIPLERKCVVAFKDVHVRVHEFILCENPACSRGPSIGLGWNYYDMEHNTVDDFERNRYVSRFKSRRRIQEGLLLSPGARVKIAKSMGYTTFDIADIVRKNNKIKHQRSQTILNPGVQKYEEALETATRNMKKLLFCINNGADPCDEFCTP